MGLNGIRGISVPDQRSLPGLDKIALPKMVVLPLASRWGEAAPTVQPGDKVAAGQCVAVSEDDATPPVHSSISGTVKEISYHVVPQGRSAKCIVIESDGQDSRAAVETGGKSAPEDILRRIMAAGIREVDDHPLPLAQRLANPDLAGKVFKRMSPSLAQPIETLIINGMDRQPGDMVRRGIVNRSPEDLLAVVPILKELTGAGKIVFAYSQGSAPDNSLIDGMKSAGVETREMSNKFPVALEPILAMAVAGKEVPQPSGDTREVGIAVVDVATALRVLDAARDGSAGITVEVQVAAPAQGFVQQATVRTGMLLSELLEHLPPFPEKPAKAIMGGLFLGNAQHHLDVPITAETDSIIFQAESELARFKNQACTNCGYCVRYCPMRLMPNELGKFCEYGQYEAAERSFLLHCIECGICAYVCPAQRPMVQLLRHAKLELAAMDREG